VPEAEEAEEAEEALSRRRLSSPSCVRTIACCGPSPYTQAFGEAS
jgi:hypothetical protein